MILKYLYNTAYPERKPVSGESQEKKNEISDNDIKEEKNEIVENKSVIQENVCEIPVVLKDVDVCVEQVNTELNKVSEENVSDFSHSDSKV